MLRYTLSCTPHVKIHLILPVAHTAFYRDILLFQFFEEIDLRLNYDGKLDFRTVRQIEDQLIKKNIRVSVPQLEMFCEVFQDYYILQQKIFKFFKEN